MGHVTLGWKVGRVTQAIADDRYPSLLMRALGLRLVPSSPHLAKLVSYEFMNRQLVWNAFTVRGPDTMLEPHTDRQEFAMFAFPLLPRLPSYFQLSTLLAPIQSVLSRPKSIDYSSIPLAPVDRNDPKASKAAHSGPLADLPIDTCPICHLRSTSAPVPLTSSLDISLPPVAVMGQRESDEENRIFVPAQTDCWGGCRWCYYCIMGELAAFSGQTGTVSGVSGDTAVKWDCLRCGGRVTRAWRAGPEPVDSTSTDDNIAEKPVQLLKANEK
jgi:peroxin-2